MDFRISTNQEKCIIDITDDIEKMIPHASRGVMHVFVRHTTCALTTADLDPGTDLDLLDFLASLIPNKQWRHPHNPAHAPAHLLASLIGPDTSIPFENGQLLLGSWQRVILIELDGPRERLLSVHCIVVQ